MLSWPRGFCAGQLGSLVNDVDEHGHLPDILLDGYGVFGTILEWLRLHWLVGWGECFSVTTGNCNNLPVFVGAAMYVEFVVDSFRASEDSWFLWPLRVSLDLPIPAENKTNIISESTRNQSFFFGYLRRFL